MDKSRIVHKKTQVETEPLKRKIMVHMAMHYQCEVCGNIYKFWLEKGLEDKKQDEINPKNHKPVPFAIPCMCGGTAMHIAWGSDEILDDYRLLADNENYFENTDEYDCGISHFRNDGYQVEKRKPEFPELSEILDIFETKSTEIPYVRDDKDFEDDPYGLAHISTTTLKKELRRRKQSWKKNG